MSSALFFSFVFVQADVNEAKQKMKDALHMRWNNLAENCGPLSRFNTINVIERERQVLEKLTADDLQEVLMTKNKNGKTISEAARSNVFCSTKFADSFDLLLQGFTLLHLEEQKTLVELKKLNEDLEDINQKLDLKNQEDKR